MSITGGRGKLQYSKEYSKKLSGPINNVTINERFILVEHHEHSYWIIKYRIEEGAYHFEQPRTLELKSSIPDLLMDHIWELHLQEYFDTGIRSKNYIARPDYKCVAALPRDDLINDLIFLHHDHWKPRLYLRALYNAVNIIDCLFQTNPGSATEPETMDRELLCVAALQLGAKHAGKKGYESYDELGIQSYRTRSDIQSRIRDVEDILWLDKGETVKSYLDQLLGKHSRTWKRTHNNILPLSKMKPIAYYLMEVSLIYSGFLFYAPRHIAIASVSLAQRILGLIEVFTCLLAPGYKLTLTG